MVSISLAKETASLALGLLESWDRHQARWAKIAAEEERNSILKHDLSALRQQVSGALKDTHRLLHDHSVVLTVLVSGQQALFEQLNRLEESMSSELSRIAAQLAAAESREFELRTLRLVTAHEAFLEIVTEGVEPTADEISRVDNTAGDLIHWSTICLRQHPLGAPQRLPYLVAQAIAVRARSDIYAVQSVSRPLRRTIFQNRRRRAREELLEQVEAELAALRERGIYALGVESPFVVAQYVYLRRGLLQALGRDCPEQDWDDGLEDLRGALASDSPTLSRDASLPLRTLADFEWYARWRGEDLGGMDVHRVEVPRLGLLLDSLNIPLEAVPLPLLPILRGLVLPDRRDAALGALRDELEAGR
jgi:hypothetical protein